MTSTFGIEIVDVSVISANPSDNHLVASLAAAALASAETYRRETEIKGYANAKKIEADVTMRRLNVQSDVVIARSEEAKQVAIQQADGLKESTTLLETSKRAVALETLFLPNLMMKRGLSLGEQNYLIDGEAK